MVHARRFRSVEMLGQVTSTAENPSGPRGRLALWTRSLRDPALVACRMATPTYPNIVVRAARTLMASMLLNAKSSLTAKASSGSIPPNFSN